MNPATKVHAEVLSRSWQALLGLLSPKRSKKATKQGNKCLVFWGLETTTWGGGALPRGGVVVQKFIPPQERQTSSRECPGKVAVMFRTLWRARKGGSDKSLDAHSAGDFKPTCYRSEIAAIRTTAISVVISTLILYKFRCDFGWDFAGIVRFQIAWSYWREGLRLEGRVLQFPGGGALLRTVGTRPSSGGSQKPVFFVPPRKVAVPVLQATQPWTWVRQRAQDSKSPTQSR